MGRPYAKVWTGTNCAYDGNAYRAHAATAVVVPLERAIEIGITTGHCACCPGPHGPAERPGRHRPRPRPALRDDPRGDHRRVPGQRAARAGQRLTHRLPAASATPRRPPLSRARPGSRPGQVCHATDSAGGREARPQGRPWAEGQRIEGRKVGAHRATTDVAAGAHASTRCLYSGHARPTS